MVSKITNFKNASLTLLALMYSSQLYAEVHPVIFKEDLELYSKTYFGMGINEFKTKLSSSIVVCQDASRSNNFADKACKVAFKSNSYGMNEALVMFKNESLISVMYKINNDHYQSVVADLSTVYKDQPQIEKRDEKQGLFSSIVSNEYSIWAFKEYLMMVNKFDIQKYVAKGPNFLYALESTDVGFMNNIREEAKKKSKIEMQLKTANVDLTKLHQPKEPISESSDKKIEATETGLDSGTTPQVMSNDSVPNSTVKNTVKEASNGESKSLKKATKGNASKQTKSNKLAGTNWPLEPDSFMGMKFGEALVTQISECPSDITKVITENIRCYETISANAELYEAHNLANIGIPVDDIYPKVKNGVLEGVDLTFRHYDHLKMFDLFKAKYGEPTKAEKVTLQNRMGASFTGVEYKWVGKSVNIVLSEYGSKVDEGRVSVFTRNYIDSLDNESKTKAEKFKDNL